MPSRIDIGPEGGPFVAINENSNDLELQDINGNVIAKWDETAGQWDLNNNSLTNIKSIDAGSVTTERQQVNRPSPIVVGSAGWRSDFDGSDPDTRLDNALSVASDGDIVQLENATYTTDRTISNSHLIIGTGNKGTTIDASWTFSNRATIKHVFVDGSDGRDELAMNGQQGILMHLDCSSDSDIRVGNDQVIVSHMTNGTVTFDSGTSDGLVDSSTIVTVTDNGTNTVGSTT